MDMYRQVQRKRASQAIGGQIGGPFNNDPVNPAPWKPVFAVTDGASGISNNGSDAVRAARLAHIEWEKAHGEDPNEDWGDGRRYRISGAILGCLGDRAGDFSYKVTEELPGDPWKAVIASDGAVDADTLRRWHDAHQVDVDKAGKPYYFVVKDDRDGKDYVWYSDSDAMMPLDGADNVEAAKTYGRDRGIPEEQLDFAPSDGQDKKAASDDIEDMARPMYPESGSHGWNHIQDVLGRAQAMTGKPLSDEQRAALMLHDIGLYPGGPASPEVREGHEERSADMAGKLLDGRFDAKRLARVLAAIREHRASYTGKFTSDLSDLLSSADRNPPDVVTSLRRGQAWNDEHGITGDAGYRRVAEFMAGKYGNGGYARYPKHYRRLYRNELADFQREMAALTPERVKELLEKKAAAGNLGWTGSIDTTPEGTVSWIKNDVIKGGAKDRMLYGGGAAVALAGLNILRRKLGGKKIRVRDWLVPGLLGYTAGAGYQIGRDLLKGQDYGRAYDTSKLKDGDTVFIGVSGGGDGPGSELDKAMYDRLGEGNYAMFRHGDTAQLEAFIRSLPAGVKPVVIGHSYGAAALPDLKERLGRDDIEWHSIDPVSWRGKLGGTTPAGTLYLPDDAGGSIKDTANNFIATIGGRWGDRGYKDTMRYLGGHSRGVEELVSDRIIPGYLQ